jgi:hypothetical protein
MPNNTSTSGWAQAGKILGAAMEYNKERNKANVVRKRKASSGRGGAVFSGGGRGGTTATIHSHGIVGNLHVVQTVHSFDLLFKESNPGVYFYKPATIALAVGKLSDFTPLAARTKVRFSFASDVDINVTWDGANRLITRKRYTTPWMDLHIALPLRLTCYGKEVPHGEYVIECAGLIDWDAELQNRARLTYNLVERTLPGTRATRAVQEEDESSDEEAEARGAVPSGPPKANTAVTRSSATKSPPPRS